MNMSKTFILVVLALAIAFQPATSASLKGGRKLMQGAGVGQGCDSIFTQADNGSGYTVEDTENAVAGDLGKAGRRLLAFISGGRLGRTILQGAGVGQGCNSIFNEADNGSGYTVEDTEDAAAKDIGRKLLSATRGLKQANKVADGANTLLTAAGDPQLGNAVDVVGNDYDGQGTNDAAAAGQEVGQAEASLPEATEAIPGRRLLSNRGILQANKIANGADTLLTAAHDPQLGQAVGTVGDDYDNQLTNDFANTGAEVGDAEASLPEVTEAIPGKK